MSPKRIEPTAVLFCFSVSSVMAQFSSAIQGNVTDSSGGVVPAASVRVVNTASGVSRVAVTSDEGLYRVLNLGPGTYRIIVEKGGFGTAERESVALGISETVRADFVMRVGETASAISVVDQSTMVETEQGRISGRVEQVQLRELPLNGRNLYNLIALTPGITGRGLSTSSGAGGTGADSFSGESSPQINASGERQEGNTFTLDDTSINSAFVGGLSNLTPNVDSVEEIRVVSNNFSAAEGRSSAARIQVISKRGTNQFHGGAAYYFQNNTLASRNEFEGASVPVFRRNQFAYNVGGPIIKNRTFFFHSYEGVRGSGARAQVVSVETPAFRNFVLSTRPNSIAAKVLKDFAPAVDPTFNFIKISPLAGANTTGLPADLLAVGSAQFIPTSFRNGNQYSLRLDHELRPGKDNLYLNFYRTNNNTQNGQIRPLFNKPTRETTYFVGLNETHIFSPNKINELKVGFLSLVGRPNTPPHLEIPLITVPQIPNFGDNAFPQGWFQYSFNYQDAFTWIRANHQIKIGGEARRLPTNSYNTTNFVPTYTFADILSFANDQALQMTRHVDPRTGDPATDIAGLRKLELAFYVQDDWKVTPNFSINVGLRYENYLPPIEVNGLIRTMVLGPGATFNQQLATASSQLVDHNVPADNKNFAPRFGFAWSPGRSHRTSIRGGYGIAFDRLFNYFGFRANPPLRADVTLGSLLGTRFTYSLGDPSKPFLGYPVDPALRAGLDQRNGIIGIRANTNFFDPTLSTAYVQNWFLGIQQEVRPGWVVEVNFTGSAGRKLYNQTNVNRFAGDLLSGVFHGFNPSFNNITMTQSNSNSIYLGGSVSVRRAFSHGFTLQSAFTFGKVIDDADSLNSTTAYQDVANRRLDRALAGFDVPQKFSILGVWELPIFRNQRRLTGKVLGGWQLAGSTILQKGLPLSVSHSAAWPRGDFNADGTTGDRPNNPGAEVPRSGFSRSNYLLGLFPASAFPTPVRGTTGSLGRNTFRGPGFAQTDLSFSKKFPLTERVSGQLRIDGFNAFNRVNLTDPVMDLNSSNFGRSTSTFTPRIYQLGLRIMF